MIRVLQLLPQEADFQTARMSQALARRDAGVDVAVRTIGRGGRYSSALDATLSLRNQKEEHFDVVHAMGERALIAAAVGRSNEPICYSPLPEAGRRSMRWLRAAMAYRNIEVVCPTATLRRAHVQRGVPLERCHLIRPGVDFAKVKRRRDPSLRAQLGLGENDVVLLGVGESTRASAHERAVWGTAILGELDRKYRLLLWGRGDRAVICRGFALKLHQPALVTLAEQRLGRKMEFEELLPAADVVLNTVAGLAATLPLSITMAAALPIVSTVTYTASELLEDHHTALMVPKPSPRLIARRVLDLLEDSQLQWNISDMARTEAYEYFSVSRFVNAFRDVYRQIAAAQRVIVEQQAPGAGLRFHGRA